MCQVKNSKELFGGVSVFMMAYFGQIGPINGTSSVTALDTNQTKLSKIFPSKNPLPSGSARSLVRAQAARLFQLFQRQNLTEQVRAGSDEVHCAFIRRSEFSAEEPPVNADVHDILYERTLSPGLLLRDPLFEDAIYVVQANRERELFNKALLYRFAARRWLTVFKWIRKVQIRASTPCYGAGVQFHEAGAHEMMAYLVQGMPVFINNKQGHVSRQISNGRLGYACSFTRAAEDSFAMLNSSSPTGEGGVEYLIPQPSHVNILLAGIDESAPDKNSLILPLPRTSDKGAVRESFFKRLGSRGDRNPEVFCQGFQYEIAFARTYEKLQGSNLVRLVEVLADHSESTQGAMTTPCFYVGSARVSFHRHLSFFPVERADMKFLLKLRIDRNLRL